MALTPLERKLRRLNTSAKLNTALRTALNNLIGAEQRRATDPTLFEERYAWVERLLVSGADPAQPTPIAGFTLLHWAAHSDSPACVQLLVSHGADPEQPTRQNPPQTPYQIALARAKNIGSARQTVMVEFFENAVPVLHEQWALRQALSTLNDPPTLNASPAPVSRLRSRL